MRIMNAANALQGERHFPLTTMNKLVNAMTDDGPLSTVNER
jgi:hypothetical protein